MPSIDEIFSGNTLQASDIQGREPTVTIASVEPREFTDKETKKVQKKLVLSFHGATKVLICNKTNALRIGAQHGKDYDKWVGKKITLFVDPFVQFGNQLVSAVRVKPTQSTPAINKAPPVKFDPDPMPELDRNANGDVPF